MFWCWVDGLGAWLVVCECVGAGLMCGVFWIWAVFRWLPTLLCGVVGAFLFGFWTDGGRFGCFRVNL